jgi:hypothetical protein
LYGYLGTDELDEIETLGDVTLEEWQASKLREINDEYLGSNR